MSAKLGAIMHLSPKSSKAHGACSREDPHPKLAPVTKTLAWRHGSLFNTNSGFSLSPLYRNSKNAAAPNPVRLIVFKNCFGIILSVSMLVIGSGAAIPVNIVKGSIPVAPLASPTMSSLVLKSSS